MTINWHAAWITAAIFLVYQVVQWIRSAPERAARENGHVLAAMAALEVEGKEATNYAICSWGESNVWKYKTFGSTARALNRLIDKGLVTRREIPVMRNGKRGKRYVYHLASRAMIQHLLHAEASR